MSARTAALLGATGLVGGHVLDRLARDARWSRVVTLDRRPLAAVSPMHEPHVVDFDDLEAAADRLAVDDLFCCLGTTMKRAGSKAAFRRVDLEIPVEAARLARAHGAHQMLVVSALGADASSRIFYNRTKGEAEKALRALGFPALQIFQPSLLTGDRDEDRLGERIGELVLGAAKPLLIGPLRPFRPTPARAVAAAMVAIGGDAPDGVHTIGPESIRSYGQP